MNNQAPSFAERLAFQPTKVKRRVSARHTKQTKIPDCPSWRSASTVAKAWR